MNSCSRASYHESGHAIAIVAAFRDARWLPGPMPSPLIRSVEITEHSDGQWTGLTRAAGIYPQNSLDRLTPRYAALAEASVMTHLAGGICEALALGERHQVLQYARDHCGIGIDLQQCTGCADDLRRLGLYDEQQLVARTRRMLLANWVSIERVAEALTTHRRIDGHHVEAIIDRTQRDIEQGRIW